jgi:hypothetical protein
VTDRAAEDTHPICGSSSVDDQHMREEEEAMPITLVSTSSCYLTGSIDFQVIRKYDRDE